MRFLVTASFPVERFNQSVRDGTAGQKISQILEAIKPEAVYFTEFNGRRTALLVMDLTDASKIPAIAEPWFLHFDAAVEFHPTMTPDDLRKADLGSLGKKWG